MVKKVINAYDLNQITINNFTKILLLENYTMQELRKDFNLKEILNEDQRSRIVSRKYSSGETVFREGEQARGMYFLKSGILALTHTSSNGTESLLRIYTNCCFFGHRTFITQDNYHGSATIIKEAEVKYMNESLAHEILNQHHDLLMHMTRNLAIDLKNAENRLRDMVGKRAAQRVIETLIYLKHQTPDFSWGRREIGEFCGVKTETVSRSLSELEEKGFIEREARRVTIVDEEKLIAYLQQDNWK